MAANVDISWASLDASASGAFVDVSWAQLNATPVASMANVDISWALLQASPQQLGGGMAVYAVQGGKWVPVTTYRVVSGAWA